MSAPHIKLEEAFAFYERGQLAQAKAACEELLMTQPADVDILHLLGVIESQSNNPQRAVELFNRAIASEPNRPAFYANRGNALLALSRFDEAVKSYDQAIIINPNLADVHFNRGNALLALNQIEAALDSYEQAIKINPHFAQAYGNRGNVMQELKRFSEAVQNYDQAISINPNYVNAYFNRGKALHELKQFEKALENYNRVIDLTPNAADAYFYRANAHYDLKQFEQSVADYDRAINIQPDFADAFHNRGLALIELNELDKAIESYSTAITLKPNFAEVYFNRGNALKKLTHLNKAINDFDHALLLNPNYAEAYLNRGGALLELKQWEAAIQNYDHAISLKPDYAEAYNNKSVALLSRKNFEQGWELYEWRLALDKNNSNPVRIVNSWNGKKMQGPLLVLSEQGLGDDIFFAAMLNDLQAVVDNITVLLDHRLIPLYQRSFPYIEFISKISLQTVHEYEAQIFIGSLGRYFRANQQAVLDNVKVPYLKVCAQKTERFRNRLNKKKLICGLSWISKNVDLGFNKTLKLTDLKPVLTHPDIEFVNLQYGDTEEEQAAFYLESGVRLAQSGIDNFNDIDGLASLIDACDVVLTISNTTAHLGGALGKNVIVMLPYAKGLLWYWHEGEGNSPWYPTVRLVKQKNNGDWGSVVEQVKSILETLIQTKKGSGATDLDL